MDHEILDRPVRHLLTAGESNPVPIFVKYVIIIIIIIIIIIGLIVNVGLVYSFLRSHYSLGQSRNISHSVETESLLPTSQQLVTRPCPKPD
jgi:flagellar basal body-associated protein FliL